MHWCVRYLGFSHFRSKILGTETDRYISSSTFDWFIIFDKLSNNYRNLSICVCGGGATFFISITFISRSSALNLPYQLKNRLLMKLVPVVI